MGKIFFEFFAEGQAEVVVESDEAGVEGGVVDAGEAEAVLGIEAVFRELAPWDDMAGDE